jgi:protein O-GlcNAc transferase
VPEAGDAQPQTKNPTAAALQAKLNQGLALHRQGKLADAERCYGEILQRQPDNFEALHLLGVIARQTRRPAEALASYDKAIALKPDHAVAHYNRGNALTDLKRPAEALASYDSAIALKPDFAEAHYNRGNALRDLNRHTEALVSYDKAIALKPDFAEAHNNRGTVLTKLKRPAEALASYDRAIELKPDVAEAHNNRGNALRDLNRHTEALVSYDKAIALKPDFAEAHNNRGNGLRDLTRPAEALASYDKAIALKPDYAVAQYNRGNALTDLKRPAEALASYDKAIALKPDVAEAHNNRGNALRDLNRPAEALASYDKAIALKPDVAEAHNNRGNALRDLNRPAEALASYKKAIALKPDFEFLHGDLMYMQMTICDWSNFDSQLAQLVHKIEQAEKISHPFAVLAATNSPELQRKAAEIYALAKYPLNRALPKIAKRQRHNKVRIAYVSADFRQHAIAYSIVGFIEALDRDRFDVIGISLRSEDPSEIGQRIKRAFSKFIDVSRMSDQAVVQLMRELEVDIAIDLMGYIKGNRTNIFAQRAAPVQVSHIGFPGTMGAEYIDYIIADRIVIPLEDASFFSEKIVRMPDTYWATDRKLAIAQRTPTRTEVGLPNNAFVFCCFNNSYKITPAVFDCWMKILKQVDGSVLWLFEANATATSNLGNEALARGLSPERLVFAKRMPLSDHLARHCLADLFLDTLPYNAHTTASDALWGGLPVLTCLGETFVGRVAASLLNATGLPDLVTTTLEAYEQLAIDLATHPEKLAAIKRKLAENRLTMSLFDTQLFTKHIEAAYSAMYERYQAGLPPDHIVIPK